MKSLEMTSSQLFRPLGFIITLIMVSCTGHDSKNPLAFEAIDPTCASVEGELGPTMNWY